MLMEGQSLELDILRGQWVPASLQGLGETLQSLACGLGPTWLQRQAKLVGRY
jgi:hypothetical protein